MQSRPPRGEAPRLSTPRSRGADSFSWSPRRATIPGMTAALITLALLTLATTRITRAIVNDKIADPIRTWVVRRNGENGWWTYLFHCPWCMGWWLAAPAAALATWPGNLHTALNLPAWLTFLATWAAISYATGWILTRGEAN